MSDKPKPRPEPILAVKDLAAGYGGPPVVRGVDFAVGLGEVATVVGPNGAGKSTLLKAIVGMVRPQGGTVHLRQRNVSGWSAERLARAGVGYVPQSNEVFGDLSVAENLEMGGYLCPRRLMRKRREEITDIFPTLRAMMNRRADKLSGGERKLVAMGRALMNKPQVLVLDEPTAGLSPELSTLVLETQVSRLAEAGSAIFMVEQKAIAALGISDWGYVLVAGKVFLSEHAATLLARSDLSDIFLGQITGEAVP